MRRSVPLAVLTSMVFMWAVLWPDVARARDTAAPPPAADDGSLNAAKQHFEAGRAAYNAADYPGAIREFKAAEALRPSPILAYNIGLANEKLGRRRVAVRYYKRYLEGAPAAANKAEVEGRITTLEHDIAAQPQVQPTEQPQDNPPPPAGMQGDPNGPPPMVNQGDPYAGQAPMTTAPPRKKRNLWWVWLIVGIGGVALITGIVVAVVLVGRSDTYYYAGPLVTRPEPVNRASLIDRNALVPPSQRGPDIAPLLQVRF